jgi:peptidoglycan/LPS O-acetylase OafA/YrhL
MYIFQEPVGDIVTAILKRLFSIKPDSAGVTILYVAILIAFSSASLRILEEPANRFLKRKLAPSPVPLARGARGALAGRF